MIDGVNREAARANVLPEVTGLIWGLLGVLLRVPGIAAASLSLDWSEENPPCTADYSLHQ